MRLAAHQNILATVIRGLASAKSPGCLLDSQGAFLFVNEAWDRHAVMNGGSPQCLGAALIGTSWLDHIQGDEVRRIHAELLARALAARAPNPRPLIQVSESNTPTTAGLLSTRLEPVLQGGEALGVSIVHSTVRERPIEEVYDIVTRPADAYRDAQGEIVQCSCCRRVRDVAEPERWDFVPELLATPPRTLHAICELCAELHYRPLDAI